MTQQELQALRDQHDSWLRSQPGVVGTGIGLDQAGQIAIKVFTNQISKETQAAIRQRFGNIPLALEETGEIRKQM